MEEEHTTDGSIAKGCMDYLNSHIMCRTLCTHYKELSHNLSSLSIKPYTFNVLVKPKINFSPYAPSGKTSASYGIEVARIAGLPDTCLKIANAYKNTFITFNVHKNPKRLKKASYTDVNNLTSDQAYAFLEEIKKGFFTNSSQLLQEKPQKEHDSVQDITNMREDLLAFLLKLRKAIEDNKGQEVVCFPIANPSVALFIVVTAPLHGISTS